MNNFNQAIIYLILFPQITIKIFIKRASMLFKVINSIPILSSTLYQWNSLIRWLYWHFAVFLQTQCDHYHADKNTTEMNDRFH